MKSPGSHQPFVASGEEAFRVGRDQSFDSGWRFQRGVGNGHEHTNFDDSHWRIVSLPHDWSIEDLPGEAGPFDKAAIGGAATGFTTGGEGWYRRHIDVAGLPADAQVEIEFDGVYLESDVWLNGRHIGRHVNGYTAFAYDLSPYLQRTGPNVIAVRVRNEGQNSRWYSGSGVYRQVTLNVFSSSARIARLGVGAHTRAVIGDCADVDVETQLLGVDQSHRLITRLVDHSGVVVAEKTSPADAQVSQSLKVRAARLWSPDDPYLYTLETELFAGSRSVDLMRQAFGLRIITFETDRGFRINDEAMTLRGGCIHHDNGLLGASAFRAADVRRVRLLKARGFNAIRSAHNPTSRSLREACDRLGMLLIEEAFDAWHESKNPQDFSAEFSERWEEALDAWVSSARNSPSVIMWSIGNEIPDRASLEGVEWQWRLANRVRSLDPTRPVTAGLHGLLGPAMVAGPLTARPGHAGQVDNASSLFLDVVGYNYRLADIEAEQASHPWRIVYASETYTADAYDYDQLAKRLSYFLGEFVWTALDYWGEAGIGIAEMRDPGASKLITPDYPWAAAWCGDLDLIGNQKGASLYRDVVWGISTIELAVQRPVPPGQVEYVSRWGWSDELQSWTWPGAEAHPLAVRVYTAGDKVDLLLNGVMLATNHLSSADKMRTEFAVPYAPGTLEAVTYRGEIEIGRRILETTSAPTSIKLVIEDSSCASGRQDLHYIALEVVDAQGRRVPDEKRTVEVSVDGPAELLALGSANPLAIGSFRSPMTQTFDGRALAILRSARLRGEVRVAASAHGLQGGAVILNLG